MSSASVGFIISPLLGGVVYAKAGYLYVFAMALGLIVIDILMRLIMIEKKTALKYSLSDERATEASDQDTLVDSTTREHGHSNGTTSLSKSDNASENTPLLSTMPGQKKRQKPTILVLLSIPRILAAMYGIFINVSILAAFDGVLPLYVRGIFHWDSFAAGLIFFCLAIPELSGPLVGTLSDKVGPRWVAVAGCSLVAPPLVLLRLVTRDTLEQKILLCCLLACCGMFFDS